MDAKAGAREAFDQEPEFTARCVGDSADRAVVDGALALG